MHQVRPSQCTVTGRDTVDCILDALSEIIPRPLWLLRSAILPTVVLFTLNYLKELPFVSGLMASVWGTGGLWFLMLLGFIPSVLAWSRIGFYSAAFSPPITLCDCRGVLRGVDLLGITALAVIGFAELLDLILRYASDSGQSFFPVTWVLIFSGGIIVIPLLICGGMRFLISLPAAALGWTLSYRTALELTKERSGWLAGIGVALVCMFPLTWQGVVGLRGIVIANLPNVPEVVWPWVYFGFMVLLSAVTGHCLGQVLRRLLDGVPDPKE